jgi:O-antigen/teichoic acid export membrane protein
MRRVSRNTLILFVNNVGGAAFSFASAVLIGRALGQSGLGQYAFVLAWLTPFTMLADFGLGTLVTRDAARDRTHIATLLHTANQTLPLIAGFTWLLSVIAVIVTGQSSTIIAALIIGSLLIVLDPWYGLYTAVFRAFEQMRPILIVNVGGLALQFVLTAMLLYGGAGVIGVIAALIVINIGQLLAIWLWWRAANLMDRAEVPHTVGTALRMRVDRFALLRRAAPFALAAVIGALSVRLNVLILDRLTGDAATGQYSAASRFVEAGRLLPNAAFGALFPALAALTANKPALRHFFKRAAMTLGGLSTLLAISLTISASWLIRLSYGAAFNEAAPVLALLSWSLLPATGRGLLSLYLYSIGREGVVNRVGLLTLALQAVIGLMSIAALGAMGAALTAILTESAALITLGWLTTRAPKALVNQP